MTPRAQACPSCRTELPVLDGFITWCHACGWNLQAPEPPAWHGRAWLGRASAVAGRRLGERLVTQLTSAEQLAPRMTPSKALAYLIAALVHATALAFAVGGVVLIVLPFPNVVAIAAGIVLIGLGVLMRPRLGKTLTVDLVAPAEAPTLHAMVDRISKTLDAPRPHAIAVHGEFNASWSVHGIRRRRLLTLGLPLLAALDPQERVALIAHELAHGRNGDATHGLLVGSAVRGLSELYAAVAPGDDVETGELGFVAVIVKPLMWLVSRPILGLVYLEAHLLLRDSQRGEYLADALAAEAAGTAAAIAMHEKLLLASSFTAVVQRMAFGDGSADDLFSEVATRFRSVPERERERRRRVARLEDSRLEDTHPPTGMRIRLLEARPSVTPLITVDHAESAAVEVELQSRAAELSRRLVDHHRDTLFY